MQTAFSKRPGAEVLSNSMLYRTASAYSKRDRKTCVPLHYIVFLRW